MSVVTELILSADSESRYPAPKEIRIFQDFLKSGDQRIRIAKNIVTQTVAKSLLYTDITAPGGNMYTCRFFHPLP